MTEEIRLECLARRAGDSDIRYIAAAEAGLECVFRAAGEDGILKVYRVTLRNSAREPFRGVIHVRASLYCTLPAFFMPGYMYNRNTGDMPSSGRKPFPRIRRGGGDPAASDFWMTRSDRLAEPLSVVYDGGRVFGVSAEPYVKGPDGGPRFRGFTCGMEDSGRAYAGYTLGYENAPKLFVTTAEVHERAPLTEENTFTLRPGEEYAFELAVYDYAGKDGRAVYSAVMHAYRRFHEPPRSIPGMDARRAVELLSAAVRDYAGLEEEKCYTGFVYDGPDGATRNRIPSVSWTNGLAVAAPMLMAADLLEDEKARAQSLTYIEENVLHALNPESGFLYESTVNGKPSVRGWWYDGMHSGGHSGYINGQAVYYLLKAYRTEKEKRGVSHENWLALAGRVVTRINETLNGDGEYPFAMSETTGAGIEYGSMGSSWCLAASAMYELVTGDRELLPVLKRSEEHYFEAYVRRAECSGGPLDTDKAVDDEGILAYIRAVRLLHEITGEAYLLARLRDALYYEFTFKLGYNTPVTVRPLSGIGWSSCGGSITSVANPHIHPMSSSVIGEMRYYLTRCMDPYAQSRLDDTVGWSLQTFNTRDGEYGYGKTGWMSERFCFCQGLLTERYPDGEPASTWFALMPWASASIIEGLTETELPQTAGT